MARLIVIDHSLKAAGGHHFDYALRVVSAAESMGLQTVLATHRAFQGHAALPTNCRLRPVFRHTTYSRFTMFQSSQRRRSFRDKGRFNQVDDEAQEQGMSRRLWNAGRQRHIQRFARDCQALLRQESLESGDHVFLPTISELDLLGLSRFLQTHDETCRAIWHLQFHFGFLHGWEPDHKSQHDRLEMTRSYFSTAMKPLLGHQVYCYNTSEGLAQQYNQLKVAEFQPLSYPINPALKKRVWKSTDGRPLRVTVAGAVRPEKGQQALAGIVADLWHEYLRPGRVQLVVQTKHSRWTGRPRLSVPIPHDGMSTDRAAPIVYVPHPLDMPHYEQLIRETDIGLLLYDPHRYSVRRAGILCEYLMAGVPSVVPAGCWLGDQISEPIQQYLRPLWNDSIRITPERIESLSLPCKSGAAIRRSVPRGSRALLLRVACQPGAGRYRRLRVVQYGADNDALVNESRIVGGDWRGGAMLALTQLQPQARSYQLSVFDETSAVETDRFEVQLKWLDAECRYTTRPLGQVGWAAADVEQMSSGLKEIVNNYPHYQQTAAAFSSVWLARHDPRRTVRELMARPLALQASLPSQDAA